MSVTPAITAEINAALARLNPAVRPRLLELRRLIYEVASTTPAIGPLTETLKWGEPAYLTTASKSGTTIRLGVAKSAPDDCALFFNCKTSLIQQFREQFSGHFRFEGNRALIISSQSDLPVTALLFCIHAALIYHKPVKPAVRQYQPPL